MPIYDYLCSNCNHRTEVIHGINDPAPRFCPSCGAEGTLRKAFSTPAILFKGSGWAKKDRAATRTPAAARASDGGSSEASSDTSAPGDSTPPRAAESSSTASNSGAGESGGLSRKGREASTAGSGTGSD